jgi:hypothetical protein
MQAWSGSTQNVYRPRKPKASPLWQCLSRSFDTFLKDYEASYQPRYGFLRPVIPEVVGSQAVDLRPQAAGNQLRKYIAATSPITSSLQPPVSSLIRHSQDAARLFPF